MTLDQRTFLHETITNCQMTIKAYKKMGLADETELEAYKVLQLCKQDLITLLASYLTPLHKKRMKK